MRTTIDKSPQSYFIITTANNWKSLPTDLIEVVYLKLKERELVTIIILFVKEKNKIITAYTRFKAYLQKFRKRA